jgi:hypothetical protein
MKVIRFHFEDQGQDFSWWDVADNGTGVGRVVDCGPFQAAIWANGKFYVNLGEPHGIGDRLVTTDDLVRSTETGYAVILNYAVTEVEQREKPVCSECGCIDERACVNDGVPCHWAAPDLCSACADKAVAA